MKQTAFIFGRTPKLSLRELQSFYPNASLLVSDVAVVSDDVDATALMEVLGGTVKIADIIAGMPEFDPDAIESLLESQAHGSHLTFGISAYGGLTVPQTVLASIKKRLTERGISARYVETTRHESLSSVVIAKQQVMDVVVIKTPGMYHIGVTRAVQSFEDWNKRDFGRPAADPKAGMLPPKVARMIVNIALAGHSSDHHPMVLDPFCGVGTILAESLLRGANVVGSDVSEAAVTRAKKNLEWLRREFPIVAPLYANVLVSDATHVSEHLAPQSIDAVVTEPFMGDTVEAKDVAGLTPDRVKNILKGLEKLYIGALREWHSVLAPHAVVVMAMPAYVTDRGIFRVKKVVDRCASLGYTLLTEPIEYSRPQAVVRREFYIFQKI